MSEQTSSPKRAYRLRRRAEAQERTRRSIAQAALELHSTVGPANTTISAVAERAGVERLTVYRHFPTPVELFTACRGLHFEQDPPPGVTPLLEERDPERRLRAGLTAFYGYYDRNERLAANLIRDAASMPAFLAEGRRAGLDAYRTALVAAWRVRRPERRARIEAAIGVALEFGTWRSLVRDRGMIPDRAVDLMVGFVRGAGAGT